MKIVGGIDTFAVYKSIQMVVLFGRSAIISRNDDLGLEIMNPVKIDLIMTFW